jgi:protein dithiol oxidoreductase (disulfide-forming)
MKNPLNTSRREFSSQLIGLGFATSCGAIVLPAKSQSNLPVEGTHYIKLSQPIPPAGSSKIEVVEFFWYGCPHCNAFEPLLEAWAARLPADVAFKRVPVAFRETPFIAHQKLFYTLEALGLVPSVHKKVFYAVHQEKAKLDSLPDILKFIEKNKIDQTQFTNTFNSFEVNTKATRARKLADAYKIDGVPSLGVHGRYYTTGSAAGSTEKMLPVTDHLIKLVRQKGVI